MQNLLCSLALLFVLPSMAEPAWLNNRLGLEHEVPKPWSEVRFQQKTAEIWGRTFQFADCALPEQVENQQEFMLLEPLRLVYESEKGQPVTLQPVQDSLKILEQYPDYLVLSGQAEAPGIKADIRTELWFEGFMKITVDFDGSEELQVLTLSLIAPFNPEVMGPDYVLPFSGYAPELIRGTWGQATRDRKFPHSTFFTVSGKKCSLMFLSECPENWLLQRRSAVYQLFPGEDDFTFQVNFIDVYRKTAVGKRRIEFGLVWGPARPSRPDWRQYTALWWEARPDRVKKVSELGLKPLVTVWPFSLRGEVYSEENLQKRHGEEMARAYARASRVSFNIPLPENPDAYSQWLAETRAAGGLITPYVNADNFDPEKGAGSVYKEEWSGKPLPETIDRHGNGFAPQNGGYVCFQSQSWADYYVYTLTEAMKTWKYEGYYIDNCGSHPCKNPNHPKSHQPYQDSFGKNWERDPLFTARMLYLRLYRAILKVNPDAVFYVNGGFYYPFWDFSLTAEYLSRLAGNEQIWPEFVTVADTKGEFFSGRQSGTRKMLMAQYSGKNAGDTLPTRSTIAATIPGDLAVHWEITGSSQAFLDFDALKAKFRIWDAEWIPHWENKDYLNTSSENVLLTLYKKPDEALIFVSNAWNSDERAVDINLVTEKLFSHWGGELQWEDMETGNALDSTRGMFLDQHVQTCKILVQARDYRALRCSKKKP